ncbi:hypothetical protein NX794_06275 [Streptomyces sp. LP11]|uniref:Secreted protein n=1 Tax=Streptomyces pyxinicus TaxID=2970331 RepID=A0ABT2AX54_9ACTN|nr:hypothetical protein [Streptomyces sp. LP11]MCS0600836.1 hypothetical protein [Streptomyces sp. LP11]
MTRLICALRVRFCVAITALVACGFVGAAQHAESVRTTSVTTSVTAADCMPHFRCDDTSWGG